MVTRVPVAPDPRRQELRDLRQRLRIGIFASGGYGNIFRAGDLQDFWGPLFGAGAFLRKNFKYRVGVLLRAGIWSSVGDGESEDDFNIDYSGFMLRASIQPSLRIGPFAQRFPFYFDIGAHFGLQIINVDGTDPSGEEPTTDLSLVRGAFGVDLAIGFVVGRQERIDFGIRSHNTVFGSEFSSWGTQFWLGVAIL